MKKEAESRGAELAPISWTLGMSSGSGVVSMRTCWLNLGIWVRGRWAASVSLDSYHLGCLADMLCGAVRECGRAVVGDAWYVSWEAGVQVDQAISAATRLAERVRLQRTQTQTRDVPRITCACAVVRVAEHEATNNNQQPARLCLISVSVTFFYYHVSPTLSL